MKYKFTGNTRLLDGVLLRQIVAVTAFGGIAEGDVGGWIEKESNLSHEGNSWVFDNACVYGSALVRGNAWVSDNAMVFDDAIVSGDAIISDWVGISGHAYVTDGAKISGYVDVFDYAEIFDNAVISGDVRIYGHSSVYGDARVSGYVKICEYACVYGYTRINGNSLISGNSRLFDSLDSRFEYINQDLEYLAEEAECVTMFLDAHNVPKCDGEGTYSLLGRIQQYVKMQNGV